MAQTGKKKIAFLGIKGLPSRFGADRVVEGIVDNLAEDFDIYVYCSESVSKDYHPEHIRLIKIKHPRGKHLFSFSLSLLSALHALFFGRFDLVNVHNTDSGFIVPLLRLRYKVVGTSHGFAYKRGKWGGFARRFFMWSEKIMMSFSTAVTCVSKSITEELETMYNRDVTFIPNGIDKPGVVEDPATFAKYGFKDKEFICFAAGRVDPTKGCHLLLEAFQKIDRDIQLVTIGDFGHKKDYTEELHRMADGRVTFVPFIAEKEILFGIINNSKLFVFPSTVEAMSIMLLEVAALGVPVVCSEIPENTTVLEDRTTYFSSGDSNDLREKIDSCLDNYDNAVEQARDTKTWVLETYNWKSIAAQYRALYNDLTR
jgi:glycosyltransferase involved in cell wall biosynthesis